MATRSAARSVGAEVALSPAQRAAMIYALDLDRRDELVERSVEAVREVDGVDLVLWLTGPDDGRRRSSAAAAASCGSRPAIRWRTIAAGAGTSRATCRRSWARSRTGASCAREYPDALARIWSALKCPTAGDVLLSAVARLRVRRLGRRRPRRRRQPRLAAPLGFARRAAVVRHRPGVGVRPRHGGRCATSRRWFASILRLETGSPG